MTGSSSVVLSNLAYLIGAVVLAVIGGFAVWLHHRQPKSIDANVDAFQRGLQAIAPDSSRPGPMRPSPVGPAEAARIRPRSSVTLQPAPRRAPAPTDEVGAAAPAALQDEAGSAQRERAPTQMTQGATQRQAAAGDGAGDRAGADTG
jgi:hypothetical protein